MRKIIVANIVTLNGCFEGAGKNVMAMPMDGAFDQYNLERMKTASTVLLGHKSYQMFSGFWPAMAENPDASEANRNFSRLYNKVEKIVVSESLTGEDLAGPWKDTTRIIDNDKYDQIAKLKEEDGDDIVIYASRALWNDLLAHGLVDELHFVVGNVVLIGGTPVFDESIHYNDPKVVLNLTESRTFEGSNNLLSVYKVDYKTNNLAKLNSKK